MYFSHVFVAVCIAVEMVYASPCRSAALSAPIISGPGYNTIYSSPAAVEIAAPAYSTPIISGHGYNTIFSSPAAVEIAAPAYSAPIISGPGYNTIYSSPAAVEIATPACSAPIISGPASYNFAAPALSAPVYPAPVMTIIDDSVSNNLANVLQLLVVSNLLENTLPFNVNGLLAAPAFAAPACAY